jgi:HTH-type transcriptional regulator / antitoxin HigA
MPNMTGSKQIKSSAPKAAPIKPIRNDRDHSRALKRIDHLWDSKKGTPEHDEFEVLFTLVESYEAQHHVIPPPTPLEAIEFRMDQMGWTRADLAKLLGSRSRVSEIFSGKRKLSLEMMRLLHKELGVPAESLLAS